MNQNLKIQICSDLHLEFNTHHSFEELVNPVGDILILAGDIGNPFQDNFKQFLTWCSTKFGYVCITPGNHEYYHSSIEETDKQIEKICNEFSNVIFLQRKVLKLGNTVILGCTLWSNIPDDCVEDVYERVNDHRGLIKGFDIPTRNLLHLDHYNWILETLDSFKYDPNLTICLTTHHPLLKTKTVNKNTDCAFTNNYKDLVARISYSFAGHTHFNEDYQISKKDGGTTRIISNCRGYKTAKDYDSSKMIETFI